MASSDDVRSSGAGRSSGNGRSSGSGRAGGGARRTTKPAAPREPKDLDTAIVDNLADRWGVEATDGGKQVWFELSFKGAERRWGRPASV